MKQSHRSMHGRPKTLLTALHPRGSHARLVHTAASICTMAVRESRGMRLNCRAAMLPLFSFSSYSLTGAVFSLVCTRFEVWQAAHSRQPCLSDVVEERLVLSLVFRCCRGSS